MDSQAIVAISAVVAALTQFAKWSGVPDKRGPLAVLTISLLAVIMFGLSSEQPFLRTQIWPFFSGWISVALGAAGIFGFTRASPEAVSRSSKPPADGAGSSKTTD